MVTASQRFTVRVLGGGVLADLDGTPRGLSEQNASVLAALVAAGRRGIDGSDLDPYNPAASSPAAMRMAVTRLRKHLPPGALPPAAGRRYTLSLDDEDVDAWELTRLAEGPLPDTFEPERLRHLVSPEPIFAGVVTSELLTDQAHLLRHSQRRLLERLVDERPHLMAGDLLAVLLRHCEDDPLNERLVRAAALALARSGNRREAISHLARARREFIAVGLSMSAAVADLERALLEGRFDGSTDEQAGAVAQVPPPLRDLRDGGFFGQHELLSGVLQHLAATATGTRLPTVALTGPSGAGKSRLSAEIAASLTERGWTVLYVAPIGSYDEAAYGPFLAAIPRLRAEMERIRLLSLDPASRIAAHRVAVVEAIEDQAGGRPLLVIVDDAQWLDSRSIELVQYLASMRPGYRAAMVVAGRPDVDSSTWSSTQSALEVLGAATRAVPPLDDEAVAALVREAQPAMDERDLRGVAREVGQLSGGIPGIARHLVTTIDAESARLPSPSQLPATGVLGAVVERLGPAAREVGIVASIIGPTCRLDDLVALSGLEERLVLDGLDELVRQRLVVERSMLEFSVVHVLVQSALVRSTLQARVARVHRDAARRFAHDVHRRAYHEAAAVPMVPREQACEALLESAHAYLAEGLVREAVAAFRRITELTDGPVPLHAVAGYARALDLEGHRGDAAAVRADGVGRALAAADHGLALSIAVSGLPEAEPLDGDRALVELLQRIDPDELDDDDRWSYHRHLARQLAIVGEEFEAITTAQRACDIARTPDQRAASALVLRFTISAQRPAADRLEIVESVRSDMDQLGSAEVGELLVLSAIDRYEAGHLDGARQAADELAERVAELTPLRHWHLLLLRAMLATDDGRVALARSLRSEAFEVGLTNGLAEYTNALLGAEFVDLLVRDRTEALIGEVDSGLLDPQRAFLTRAGAAVVLGANGQLDRALVYAEQVARQVLAAPLLHGPAAAALVSDVLVHSMDADLIVATRNLLERRGRSMIVVGAGAASMGPAARYVARLHGPGAARRDALEAARDLAEQSGSLLWRAVALRDLATLNRSRAAERDLAALVADTELAALQIDPH